MTEKEMVEHCRSKTREMLDVLVQIANNPSATVQARMDAAKIVIERGYGQAIKGWNITDDTD